MSECTDARPAFVPWYARLNPFRKQFRNPRLAMADQVWVKNAKLDSLEEAVAVRDIQELGDADREAVAHFRDQKMKWQKQPEKTGDRDTWVCDDMTINAGRSSLPEVIVTAALCLGAAWGWSTYQKPSIPKAEVKLDTEDSAYEVLFYDKDGNPISVPHISTKPKE